MTGPETPYHEDDGAITEAASLLPLAGALFEAVQERSGIEAEFGLPTQIDAIVDAAAFQVAESLVREKLAALEPVEFADMYTRIAGASSLAEKMDELRAIKEADLERQVRLARIEQEARTAGVLHLENLVAEDVLTIGLFDPLLPQLAARQYVDDSLHRPLHRLLRCRLVDPASGRIEVLSDEWHGPVWTPRERSLITPHSTGRIGSDAPAEDGTELKPELCHRSTLSYSLDGRQDVVTPRQIVGYIATQDDHLLLDGAV